MEHRVHTVTDSPVGALTLVAADGILAGLYMNLQAHRPLEETFGARDHAPFVEVIRQLKEYFAAQRTEFDIPVILAGTPFQRTVWAALREIPYGETATYGQLAAQIGRPGAARAVGLANGRNPIGIIVPCHRVVGAAGALTGYGGGLERKHYLLQLERYAPAETDYAGGRRPQATTFAYVESTTVGSSSGARPAMYPASESSLTSQPPGASR